MPENTLAPADGQQGGPAAPAAGTDPQPEQGGAPEAGKTFTQEQLDAIVGDRVARAKPKDYDELKAAAAELKKWKDEQKTEIQRATDAATEAQRERDEARVQGTTAQRMSEIRIEALKQGADEEIVSTLLTTEPSIEVKDGQVVGAKEAVAALLVRKPNLKVTAQSGTPRSGGEFGGQDGTTLAEQIAALEKKGDRQSLADARKLKINQHLLSG